MRPQTPVLAALVLLALTTNVAASAAADALVAAAAGNALEIEHAPQPCAIDDAYPRIDARFPVPSNAERAPETEGAGTSARSRRAGAQVRFRAEGSPDWYAVGMTPVGDHWSATLPKPQGPGTRFVYYLVATSGDARARLPQTSSFIVDVAASCPEGGLPTSESGPATLEVPLGAPRVPQGFSGRGISAYVEYVAPDRLVVERVPEATFGAPLAALPIRPFARVRLTTVAPSAATSRGDVIWESASAVTLKGPASSPITYSKTGSQIEGRLQAVEDDTLVLALKGGRTVRVRAGDVVGLSERQPGSPALGAIGGLAGAAGGLLVTALVCASAYDLCSSVTPFWIGTLAGAALGAGAAGAPEWKPVTLARRGRVGLAVAPRRHGASAALRFAF